MKRVDIQTAYAGLFGKDLGAKGGFRDTERIDVGRLLACFAFRGCQCKYVASSYLFERGGDRESQFVITFSDLRI